MHPVSRTTTGGAQRGAPAPPYHVTQSRSQPARVHRSKGYDAVNLEHGIGESSPNPGRDWQDLTGQREALVKAKTDTGR